MPHYRLYKVNEVTRRIVKGKDVLARDDAEAMREANHDPDCPVCEVWQGAHRIGSIEHE